MLTPSLQTMKGGFQDHLFDLFNKYKLPIEIIIVLLTTLKIIFINKIPEDIRKQSNTLIGKLLLFIYITIITLIFGLPLGLYVALMSVLLISSSSLSMSVQENFEPDISVRIVPDKKKWFVEKVMGENPLLIEDQNVKTSAVQDLSEKDSSIVQSNAVTR